MQQINLDLDKENELIFKISIEGTKPATSRSRFLLETPDYALVFPATGFANGQVSVLVPTLEKVLQEGIYAGTLEVIVDDRVFEPIKLNTEFKKSIKVIAEAVVRKKEETVVSAESVVVVNRSQKEEIEAKKNIEPSSTKQSVRPEETSVHNTSEKPPQRNRIRPRALREARATETPVSKSKKLIEKISKKHGITLTEAQFKSVLRQYTLTKKSKGVK